MLSLFLLLKNEICFDLAGSSGQIFCLSFQVFFTGADGVEPLCSRLPLGAQYWLLCCKSSWSAAPSASDRTIWQKGRPTQNYAGMVGDVIRAALGGFFRVRAETAEKRTYA